MLLFYHKIHRNSTAHPILHAPIEIGNPLQNPLGGIRQNKDAEAPCEHGCGFSERDLAEQQTAAGDEENQRRQLIGTQTAEVEVNNASEKGVASPLRLENGNIAAAHTPMSAISICIRFILLFCCPQYYKAFHLKMALVIFCAFKDEIKITTNPKAMP